MRFTNIALAATGAATAAATASSTPSDLDGAVWANVRDLKPAVMPQVEHNRPVKRQSGWNPPSNLATPLKEVWDHTMSTYSPGPAEFKNYGWDQIMATKGKINMCVRWDSTAKVTEAQRKKTAEAAKRSYQKWFKWLYNYDNFPYTNIDVEIVGWAVRDKALLEGSTEGIQVYTDTDAEGIPQCAESCGRFFHQDGDYSGCAAGADRHYDQSLWLTEGMQGGAGGDWGQRIGQEYFIQLLDAEDVHILEHEMGHTFGLDDFYDWTPTGVTSFVMNAGSATKVTDFDGWMLRNWWYELSRIRGWQSSAKSANSQSGSVNAAAAPAETKSQASPAKTSAAAAPAATAKKTTPAKDSGAVVAAWQQCGGASWTGATKCASGLTCTKQNDYYSQCL